MKHVSESQGTVQFNAGRRRNKQSRVAFPSRYGRSTGNAHKGGILLLEGTPVSLAENLMTVEATPQVSRCFTCQLGEELPSTICIPPEKAEESNTAAEPPWRHSPQLVGALTCDSSQGTFKGQPRGCLGQELPYLLRMLCSETSASATSAGMWFTCRLWCSRSGWAQVLHV